MAKKVNNSATEMDLAITRSEAFIQKHKKGIIISLVALAVIVAAGFGISKWLNNREDKAQAQLSMGIALMQQGSEEAFNKALNGDGQYQGFIKIANSYSFTDAANLAKAYAGECYVQMGKYDEAIKMLEDFSFKGDQAGSPSLKATLANCYAAKGNIDKAVSTFKEAADMADNDQISSAFLLEAGNLYLAKGNKAEALKIYEQIKSDYPTSQLCVTQPGGEEIVVQAEIEKYIERAK